MVERHDRDGYETARRLSEVLGTEVTFVPMLTPEQKMERDELTDPIIRARNETIRQWIARAIRLANEPHYDAELLAKGTAYEIIRLFY